MTLSPEELREQLRGPLAFPVPPLCDGRGLDLARFKEYLRYMIGSGPHGLFVCDGTGEFYSLNVEEYRTLVRATVEEAEGGLPVVAGVGYGARLAMCLVRIAGNEGADGLLIMPPYPLKTEQEGLARPYRAIASSTRLGLILSQRGSVIFTPQIAKCLAKMPNIVGLKDGHGDVENRTRISSAAGDRPLVINGMPTAEFCAKVFAGAGAYSYSSAMFDFVPGPESSSSFCRAVTSGDNVQHDELPGGFEEPTARLRDQQERYSVSLIKAGMNMTGKAAGPVPRRSTPPRPPRRRTSLDHRSRNAVSTSRERRYGEGSSPREQVQTHSVPQEDS